MIYINKKLAEQVAKEKGIDIDLVEKCITAQIEKATLAVENKQSVRLSNLGFFSYKEKIKKEC